jgi:hypothetical protein
MIIFSWPGVILDDFGLVIGFWTLRLATHEYTSYITVTHYWPQIKIISRLVTVSNGRFSPFSHFPKYTGASVVAILRKLLNQC